MSRILCHLLVLLLMLLLSGCSAAHTLVAKRNLDVQTQMSDTIFLEPVSPELRTIYIQFRNTSDQPDMLLTPSIHEVLTERGYQVVADPAAAHYMVQANLLQIGRVDQREADRLRHSRYGEPALLGGMAGAALRGPGGYREGAVLGATAGLVTDALVKDVLYTMVTDIQISERPLTAHTVTQQQQQQLAQGHSGQVSWHSSQEIPWQRYQTRIVSTANKANLKFAEAQPALQEGLLHAITGMF